MRSPPFVKYTSGDGRYGRSNSCAATSSFLRRRGVYYRAITLATLWGVARLPAHVRCSSPPVAVSTAGSRLEKMTQSTFLAFTSSTSSLPSPVSTARNLKAGVVDAELHRSGAALSLQGSAPATFLRTRAAPESAYWGRLRLQGFPREELSWRRAESGIPRAPRST